MPSLAPAQVSLAALWLSGVLGAGPAHAGTPRPDVLLVTVDTLRPDALGWVAGRNLTPAFDAWAGEGFRFPAAVSPVPVTLPAHAALMTGLIPRRHGVRDNGQVLPAAPATLAARLQAAGYHTAAFVSGFPLVRAFGLDRGFEHYDDHLPDGPSDRRERRADATTDAALQWLRGARSPWFVWVHYYDPHDPYEAPAAWRRPGPRGDYDAEVAFVDQALGRLRQALAARPGPAALSVLTADHGESLGEHGERTHGFFIYESTLAVPLVFHFPGRVPPGSSRAPARLVDVAPTILEWCGLAPLEGVDGVSLTALLAGRPQSVPPAYVETQRPWLSYGWAPLRGLRAGDWKLIVAPRAELYDLRDDSGETRDRSTAERTQLTRLRGLLERAEALPAGRADLSEEPQVAERLRALGYVGAGSAGAGDPPATGLADPKDRLEQWNALGAAEGLLAQRQFAAALARFDGVLAREPANRFALARSGEALLELGRGSLALERLQRAVELGPQHAESRLALARALSRLGRYAAAAQQWGELTRLQPRVAAHWAGLANALGLAGEPAKAATAFADAVRLSPGDAELRVRLAFALHAARRPAEALTQLLEASRLAGAAFGHAGTLGVLLARQGRAAEALPWLRKSRPTEGDFAEARVALARLEAQAGRRDAARAALREALQAAPAWRARLAGDAEIGPLLP